MATVTLLVLDRDPASGLAGQLAAILETDPRLRVERAESGAGDGEAALASPLADRLRRLGASALFVVLPAGGGEPGGGDPEIEALAVPAYVVLPPGRPGDVFAHLRAGFADFLEPPLTPSQVLPRLWHHLERLRPPAEELERPGRDRGTLDRVRTRVGLGRLLGTSPGFVAEREKIPLIARSDAGVLITGETGTGKEVVARTIHYLSPRSAGPFVPVNCGALPTELVENELFGHERAAFTGADSSRPGLIEEADGGTLFLDEVDALPPAAQVKVLRFLQERELRRLGSTAVRSCDVRVVAATNSDVDAAVARGALRRDLFYRLNVVPLRLPPLRERREDVLLLARHFLARFAEAAGRAGLTLSEEAMAALAGHDWPGNVRELQHAIQRAVVLSGNRPVLDLRDLALPGGSESPMSFQEAKAKVVERFERAFLEDLLRLHQGNVSRAARAADKNRRAFFELLKKHQIEAARFRPR